MCEKTAAERAQELQDQCFVYCLSRGLKPLKPTGDVETTFLLMAVHQTNRTFADLNDRQRCLIAGLVK